MSTILPLASAHIQRWALLLGGFNYNIAYKPGRDHANANMLSRLPSSPPPARTPTPPEIVYLIRFMGAYPITSEKWTVQYCTLVKLIGNFSRFNDSHPEWSC